MAADAPGAAEATSLTNSARSQRTPAIAWPSNAPGATGSAPA
jgi:hypothetical protein